MTRDSRTSIPIATRPAATPLAPDRLHERVSRVHPHDHEHEQEQHQHRAGVDDHLDEGQERRAQHGVHDRERQHHDGEQQRAVHRPPGQDHAQRGGHGHHGEDPERDGLRLPAPCPRRATMPALHRSPSAPAAALFGDARVTGDAGRAEQVVVLLGLAEAHRVRRGFHARLQRRHELLLGPDQGFPAVVGELVLVGHGQRAGRARLDAQPAQDAAQVVDLVDAAVPLARASSALPRCCPRPPRRWRRPGRPRRTARTRCTSPARPASG